MGYTLNFNTNTNPFGLQFLGSQSPGFQFPGFQLNYNLPAVRELLEEKLKYDLYLKLRPDIDYEDVKIENQPYDQIGQIAASDAKKQADKAIVSNFSGINAFGGPISSIASSIINVRNINAAKAGDTTLTNGVNLSKVTGDAAVNGIDTATLGNYASIAGGVFDIARSFLNPKTEYSGPHGNLTQSLDTGYDTAANFAAAFGPVGQMVSGIMKAGGFASLALSAAGVGTDGLTTTDALLGSNFLSLTPLGLANSIGAKTLDSFTEDTMATSVVGGSYGGTMKKIQEALSLLGKKVGAFSSSSKLNNKIQEAKDEQKLISYIAQDATNRKNLAESMSAINENRAAMELAGGYQQNIYSGKEGIEIPDTDSENIENENRENEDTQFVRYLNSLPETWRDSTNYRVREYWEYNGKPKDFKEAVNKGMFVERDGEWHAYTIAVNPKTQELEFMKLPSHPTILKELDWYNSPEAELFRELYELDLSGSYWKYIKRVETLLQPQKFTEGGPVEDAQEQFIVSSIAPKFIVSSIAPKFIVSSIAPETITLEQPQKLAEGGQVNIIPEGSLHARKHNMDIDGITLKGIPVIAEDENGSIELLAEIERAEIILRKSVTTKLEELLRLFYNPDASDDTKNELALEAGKLLVSEILYNTIDNTNNMLN